MVKSFVAYKLWKELERILRLLDINLSVDKILDIAKTISTVTVILPDGSKISKTLLIRDEQKGLQLLLPSGI